MAIDPEKDYVTLVTCTPYGVNTSAVGERGTGGGAGNAGVQQSSVHLVSPVRIRDTGRADCGSSVTVFNYTGSTYLH